MPFPAHPTLRTGTGRCGCIFPGWRMGVVGLLNVWWGKDLQMGGVVLGEWETKYIIRRTIPPPPSFNPSSSLSSSSLPTTHKTMTDQLSGTYQLSHTQHPTVLLCAAHDSMADLTLSDPPITVHTLETTAAVDVRRVIVRLDRFGHGSKDETMPGLEHPLPSDKGHYNSQHWVLVHGKTGYVSCLGIALCVCGRFVQVEHHASADGTLAYGGSGDHWDGVCEGGCG